MYGVWSGVVAPKNPVAWSPALTAAGKALCEKSCRFTNYEINGDTSCISASDVRHAVIHLRSLGPQAKK